MADVELTVKLTGRALWRLFRCRGDSGREGRASQDA